jgi:hypothetical protein
MKKDITFKEDTRPSVVMGFFPNRRLGEYIMLAVGLPYRERVVTKEGRKFTKGR